MPWRLEDIGIERDFYRTVSHLRLHFTSFFCVARIVLIFIEPPLN
jgi:hypothetical protein